MPGLLDALGSFLPPQEAPQDVFMALGDYRFSMSTAAYDSFKRDTKWRWAAQERLIRSPAKQYVGPGEDTITLAGVVYPHYRGGLEQIDRIRAQADKEQPLLLVDGLGYVYDYWVITSLSETHTYLWERGVPLKQQFSLTLEYFGEDEASATAAAAASAQAKPAAADNPAAVLKGKIADSVDAIKKTIDSPYVAEAAAALQTIGKTVKDVTDIIGVMQSQLATVMAAKAAVIALSQSIANVTQTLGSFGQGNVLAKLSSVGASLGQLQATAATAARALSSTGGVVSRSAVAVDNALINVQNAAASAQAALNRLSNQG